MVISDAVHVTKHPHRRAVSGAPRGSQAHSVETSCTSASDLGLAGTSESAVLTRLTTWLISVH